MSVQNTWYIKGYYGIKNHEFHAWNHEPRQEMMIDIWNFTPNFHTNSSFSLNVWIINIRLISLQGTPFEGSMCYDYQIRCCESVSYLIELRFYSIRLKMSYYWPNSRYLTHFKLFTRYHKCQNIYQLTCTAKYCIKITFCPVKQRIRCETESRFRLHGTEHRGPASVWLPTSRRYISDISPKFYTPLLHLIGHRATQIVGVKQDIICLLVHQLSRLWDLWCDRNRRSFFLTPLVPVTIWLPES